MTKVEISTCFFKAATAHLISLMNSTTIAAIDHPWPFSSGESRLPLRRVNYNPAIVVKKDCIYIVRTRACTRVHSLLYRIRRQIGDYSWHKVDDEIARTYTYRMWIPGSFMVMFSLKLRRFSSALPKDYRT